MKLIWLFIFSGLLLLTQAQSSELLNYYDKIEKKLALDKSYLDIFAVSFQPTPADAGVLRNIQRTDGKENFSFRSNDNVTYVIMFMKEKVEIDSIVLLMIKEIENKSSSDSTLFGGGASGPTIDTSISFKFRDMDNLFVNAPATYNYLLSKVKSILGQEDARSLLGIRTDDKVQKSRGITSKNNTDFLNFQRVNNIHRYPRPVVEAAKKASNRRGKTTATETAKSDYEVDAGFSHASFFHSTMDFGFSSIGAELNMGTKVLNLVPWQGMTTSLGIRALVSISGSTPNLNEDFVIDARLMGRARINTSKFVDKLPFLGILKPKLNVGSGVIFDLQGTRAFGLPFFNLYFATGTQDFSNPFVKQGTADSSYSYFSFKQWEASMSFYWNSNEEQTMRFRMDLGVSNYDVWRAYTRKGVLETRQEFNPLQPFITLYFNFAPKNIDFFGGSVRLFDNCLNMNMWMKLFELSPEHVFRFEGNFITAPIFRSLHPWENEGGNTSVQVRYRYGFNF